MDNQILNNLYHEKRNAGNSYREKQLAELLALIEILGKDSEKVRKDFFVPNFSSLDSFKNSTTSYREKLKNMLGWPVNKYSDQLKVPEAEINFVAEDELGKIYRLNIDVSEGLSCYGLLFLPNGSSPFSLIVALHGGLGTPEMCSGFFGSENYNDMTRRILKRGFAVFAPQLLLWKDEFGPAYDRNQIDYCLKQLGGSIAALEIFKIMRSLDYLSSREDIDWNRIGMIGVSYGGFYTMYTAACDLRIKASLSSCYFNNRLIYNWPDWIWFNSANTFLDAEVCSLICPRPLYIEVAKNDELFEIKYTIEEFEKVRQIYSRFGYSENLKYKAFDGVHELNKSDEGINFLSEKISQ